jgi:hypothetical protein
MSKQTINNLVDSLTKELQDAADQGQAEFYATLTTLSFSIGIMIPQFIKERDQPEIVPKVIQAFLNGYLEGKKIAGDKDTVSVLVRTMPL